MDSSTIDKLVIPAFVSLAGVVGVLWKQLTARQKETSVKLDACEDNHAKTTVTLMDLKEEVGELRGRQQGVEGLAKSVLEAIEKRVQ